jgi:amino acid adenylation domain-containing protein
LLLAAGARDPGFRSQSAVRVDGVEPSRLREALAAVVQRHEILRTVFVRSAGMQLPSQVIREQLDPEWRVDESWDEQSRSLAAVLDEESWAPLDLSSGPLLRARLLRSPVGAQTLVLTAHSAVADGPSLLEVMRELRSSDAAEAEEPLQYADYAEWRIEAATALEPAGEDGALSPILLFGRAPVADEAFAVRTRQLPISAELAAALAAAAASCKVQRPTFVEACWHACVHRLSGAASLVIAGISDGRGHEELAGAVGAFAQPLEIKTRCEGQTSLAEIIDQVRRAREAGTRAHDALTAAALERAARSGQLSFQSFETSMPAAEIGALRAPAARFALQLSWLETADAPGAELAYDPGAYEADDVARIGSSFVALLEAAGASPSAAVDELPIVAAAERDELLKVSLGLQLDVDRRTYHELFEQQAARSPDRTAVREGERSLSYVELNGRANGLAARLRELGVGRNVPVGICMRRSVDSLVAVLGILKAGGAYLPLNFDHPAARLEHQLVEAGADVVVVEGELGERLPFGGTIVSIESAAAHAVAANPEHANEADDLVYVMYTSGSTGLPKGVAVTHANLVNYSTAMVDKLALAEEDTLQFAVVSAISTDLGNTAIFPALLCGGCVNLVAPETAMDPQAFAALAAAAGIDVLKITPSHLGALLAGNDSAAVLPRRCLVVGGEALSWDLIADVQSRAPSLKIVNHYGPTETTIGSCTFDLTAGAMRRQSATVPIGRPIANSYAYVVDASDELLPPGVAGELLLGGAGVARGYVNRAEETAERFVRDPFGAGRVYRTGDRARFLPDGTIEFLGRVDDQLKIRGFRVEPGEIEAALAGHPGVRQAAVRASEDAGGNARLVAYAVTTTEVSSEELHAFLGNSLPDYMIPSAFVSLDSMPLTASGKIDRLALPDPDTLHAGREAHYVAPRDEVEEEITRIWGELLGIERVGVFDDFFELGGHSLLATQVIMRVRRVYGDVPLQAMFMAPTPAGLAEAVRETVAAAEAAS